ncbi:MAG: vitamin B12 transporter [Flavobacteriaceae bacterium]|jgi:vitamin B12 transporter
MRWILIIVCLISFSSISQEEDTLTSQEVGEVIISTLAVYIHYSRERTNILRKKDLEELQAMDIGELLQKFEGTSIKSYGGLGGLKTVAVRSLGSQHTAVCIDGFNVLNNQTGQINLGQLQTNNVEQVIVGIGEQPGLLLPVAAQISGSSILVETFENTFVRDTFSLRSNLRQGSFGRVSGYGAAKWKVGKSFVSAYGNYRRANGKYSYLIQNGLQVDSTNRTNNDYQDYYAGVSYGFNHKKVKFRAGYKRKGINQGLPGAVILYNSSADERLLTRDQTIFTDATLAIKENWYLRAYASANKNDLNYNDPTYSNLDGKIDVSYFNRSLNVGVVSGLYKDHWDFHTGVESTVSDLRSTDSLFAQPTRYHHSAIVGARYRFHRFILKLQGSAQYIHELNKVDEAAADKFALNPFISFETQELRSLYNRHRIWYKNSFRMPSFNELYYNNIGNADLKPERADQFGYSLSFVPKESRLDWHIRLGAYYNRVRDKIVATPSKNLFVWSIQNIGKVDVYGAEIVSKLSYGLGKKRKSRIRSYVTYSYQKSLDVTDEDHPTYKHQIAYIPEHTVNFDLAYEYKAIGVRVSNYYVGKRYSLNENIVINEVDAFILSDVSVYHKWTWKEKHGLTLQLSVKNVFDKSYGYIRSFVMPGRNYLISLSYAIN